jgi:transcriptional regulator of acetoin/glycerol metabolism
MPAGTLVEAERQAMKNALAAEGGNLSRVARRLGISRPTLYRKLDQYGIRRGFV